MWIKDVVSRAPLVVYHAPEESYPYQRAVYDPATGQWSFEVAYVTAPDETVADVEAAMQLT